MKSIQSRLLIMLIIFIIFPYFLSVLLIYGYTKKNVEQYELASSQDQMQEVSDHLEQYFHDMIHLPYILYRNPDLFRISENDSENSTFSNPLVMEKALKTFYLMRREIRQVRYYIANEKNSFSIYNAMISARKHQPDLMNSFQALVNADQKFVIEPPHQIENYTDAAIIPQSDNTMVLTIHHKIIDVLSNELLGILTIDIDMDEYIRISDSLTQGGDELVFLIDDGGFIIYAKDQDLIGKPIPANLQSEIEQEEIYSDDGDIILSRTLSGPLEQWKLVKITPSEVLFYEVRQTAHTNIIVGVGVVCLGLLMVVIISYKTTQPIKLLSRKVRKIEGENMDMDVLFDDQREDEIGHLEKHIKGMMDRINLHIEREYKLEIENRKNQFKALKSQVNPHFLYNSLQSIGAVALRSNSPDVYKYVTSLSKMMRYSIRADQWVSVQNEVDYIKAYLELQMERFRTGLSYSIDIPETILDRIVPSMILQPLVENFFKHCYDAGVYEACLRIYGEIREEHLYLVVENGGPSLTDEELTILREKIYTPSDEGTDSHEHIGLKNIHDRLVLNYGSGAGIELDTKGGQGFSVRLTIPILSKEDDIHESSVGGR
ncbi:two-component system, sensor histidine kinase YesM [Evansella caseinilytica]|uniref:Two-component system, sensor histidine kinase YesM n=1 Tax=Evansella caseinilytica TaxID=1503961 RepID=A0A1H3V337_9BACI|nr:sensor histidine kinase [Evansella caseinilytica]SDZ68455.1 two-component system, sensor histidine kinase YesM [Evansella caseinilytica]